MTVTTNPTPVVAEASTSNAAVLGVAELDVRGG